MATAIEQFAPNVRTLDIVPGAGWNLIAADGSLYPTYAAFLASGKKAWPGLDAPGWVQFFSIRSAASGGQGDGSGFSFAYNLYATPTNTANSRYVSGGGQTLNQPGPLNNIWVNPSAASDVIQIQVGW